MNTNHHRPAWSLALAASALTLITACGSDARTSIGDRDQGSDSSSETGFQGSPRSLDDKGDGPASQPQDDLPQKGAR